MKNETWYVLEDGTVADPSKCAPDSSGRLACGGVPVKMRGDVYHSRSIDPDEEAAKSKPKGRDMKPEDPKPSYKTRETKPE